MSGLRTSEQIVPSAAPFFNGSVPEGTYFCPFYGRHGLTCLFIHHFVRFLFALARISLAGVRDIQEAIDAIDPLHRVYVCVR
jgi:hypothetical protein